MAMAMSKLKNIILAILIAANLLLLALVIPARREARASEQAIFDSLQQLFAEYGVTLDTALPTDEAPLAPLVLEADETAQATAARALLGEDAAPDAGAGSYRALYRAASGSCQFVHGGSFSAELSPGRGMSGELPRAAEKLLAAMGFACDGALSAVRQSAGVYTLTATQCALDAPVFSARLTLSCANGALTALSGTFLTGTPTVDADADTDGGLACADALIAFLHSRDSLGWVGSRVISVRQGYVQTETASATTVRLSPVWRVETDTGAFYVDGATGAVSVEA